MLHLVQNDVDEFLRLERKKLETEHLNLIRFIELTEQEEQSNENDVRVIERNRLTEIAPVLRGNPENSGSKCAGFSDDRSEDKENISPTSSDRRGSVNNVLIGHQKNGPRAMVRFGEFSPLNPAFRSASRPLLGLGEYEERRKIFLRKKKQEYQNYLSSAKSKSRASCLNVNLMRPDLEIKSTRSSNDEDVLIPRLFRETFSPARGVVEEASTDVCYTKLKQNMYRKELDKQVEQKMKRVNEEKNEEKREIEKQLDEMRKQRLELMKFVEQGLQCEKDNSLMDSDQFSNNKKFVVGQSKHEREQQTETSPRLTETTDVTSDLFQDRKHPVVKPGALTSADDNKTTYDKFLKEVYRKELEKQIMEKRRLKEERAAEEQEEDRKLDEIVKLEEEKLRLEYEKEQAEKAHKAQQVCAQENRLREHRWENERRRPPPRPFPPAPIATIHEPRQPFAHETPMTFSNEPHISYAREPRLFVNDSHVEQRTLANDTHITVPHTVTNEPHVSFANDTRKSDSTIIVEAPYTMATTNRPVSPTVPAVRTRNLIRSITKDAKIPSSVSLSKKAKEEYVNSKRILTNLTEIRRKLSENVAKNLRANMLVSYHLVTSAWDLPRRQQLSYQIDWTLNNHATEYIFVDHPHSHLI